MLLMDRGDLPDKAAERLGLIEESLMAASSMLHQVLDYSRKEPEKREPVDIKNILEQSLSLLKFKLAEKQIEVEKNLQSDLPKLKVDDAQIGQVFTNLSLNAMDAMKPGGTLRFAMSHHLDESARQRPYVEILVEDNGRGMPPEILDHVFEPFYTTKEKGLGTGLGLFICYGIIEKHGGTMDVDSVLDEGTQFKICLPVS
jgi:signal transduction histidine kinase